MRATQPGRRARPPRARRARSRRRPWAPTIRPGARRRSTRWHDPVVTGSAPSTCPTGSSGARARARGWGRGWATASSTWRHSRRRTARRGSRALRAAVAERVHGGGARDVGAGARGPAVADRRARRRAGHVALDEVELLLPIAVGDYVDFYSSLEHATNLGRIFRPDADPLLPNWRHLPSAITGARARSWSAGTPIAPPAAASARARRRAPVFGPTERLDIELELGFVTGAATPLGSRSPLDDVARPRLRLRAGQRLERARPAALGVPAARPVPGQVVRDLDLGLGHAARTALEPPRPGARQDPRRCDYLRTEDDWALDLALEVELNGDGRSRARTRAASTGRRPSSSRTRRSTARAARRRPVRLGHDLGPRARAARAR